jgi:hypothetical protein
MTALRVVDGKLLVVGTALTTSDCCCGGGYHLEAYDWDGATDYAYLYANGEFELGGTLIDSRNYWAPPVEIGTYSSGTVVSGTRDAVLTVTNAPDANANGTYNWSETRAVSGGTLRIYLKA